MAHDPVGEDGGPDGGKWNHGGIGSKARKFEGTGGRASASAFGKYASEGNDPELDKSWDSVSGNPKPLPPGDSKGQRIAKPETKNYDI